MNRVYLIITLIISILFNFNEIQATELDFSVSTRMGFLGEEFYRVETNNPVIFRGMNYQNFNSTYNEITFHPNEYNRNEIINVLDSIKYYQYNSIRVVISPHQIVPIGDIIFSQEYLDNVVDFLNLSKERSIYVLIVSGYIPIEFYPNLDSNFEDFGFNQLIMSPGFPESKALYMSSLLNELNSKDAPTDIIIGFEIENEPYFDLNKKPFTLSGDVMGADGVLYNLPSQKNLMIDNLMVFYINTVRSAMREVSPNILVGMALHSPKAWELNNRYVRTASIINNSSGDFYGIHIYPGSPLSLEEDISSLGITVSKPLILSEYGGYKNYYPNINSAVTELIKIQSKTCNKYNFKGWIFYDYDGYETNSIANLWRATESNNLILSSLSPLKLPDPCSTVKSQTLKSIIGVSSNGVVSLVVWDMDNPNPPIVNVWENGVFRGSFNNMFERDDLHNFYLWSIDKKIGRQWKAPLSLLTDGILHNVCIYMRDFNDSSMTTFTDPLIGCVTLPKL